MFGFNDDEDEVPVTKPDFSKIENPKVREYLQNKYQKEQEVVAAKDSRDIGTYSDIAGRFLEDMSIPTNVRMENSFKNLGDKPQRSVGSDFKYDDGGLKKSIERDIKDAEAGVAKTKADFNDSAAMDQYSRTEADYADENNPDSEVSKQYQMLAKKFVPAGTYEGVSAAKLKKLIPPLQAAYEIDIKRKAANTPQNEWFSTGKVDQNGNLIMLNRKTGETKSTNTKIRENLTPTQAKEQREINTVAAASNRKSTKLDDIDALYANTKWNGPVSGRLGELANTVGFSVNEDFDTLNQNTKSLISSYIKEMSGTAAGEKEMKRLEAVMPRPADTDATAKNKIKALKKEAEAIIEERRQAAGLPPKTSSFDAYEIPGAKKINAPTPTQGAGQVTVSNGQETFTIDQADLQDAINDGFKVVK